MAKLIGININGQSYPLNNDTNYIYINSEKQCHTVIFMNKTDNDHEIKSFKNRKTLNAYLIHIFIHKFELPKFLAYEKANILYNRKLVSFTFDVFHKLTLYNPTDNSFIFYHDPNMNSTDQSLINTAFDTVNRNRGMHINVKDLSEDCENDYIIYLDSHEKNQSNLVIRNFPISEFTREKAKLFGKESTITHIDGDKF